MEHLVVAFVYSISIMLPAQHLLFTRYSVEEPGRQSSKRITLLSFYLARSQSYMPEFGLNPKEVMNNCMSRNLGMLLMQCLKCLLIQNDKYKQISGRLEDVRNRKQKHKNEFANLESKCDMGIIEIKQLEQQLQVCDVLLSLKFIPTK